jgi:hypothetical protein
LNTNVEQEKTLLQKLSIKKSNPKMNAKYFNDVFPLESNIKQLDTDLFDGVSNVFMDLLVDRDDEQNQKYNRIIDWFIDLIKTKVDKIFKDPVFEKLFSDSVASNNGSSSIASGATTDTTAGGADPLVAENKEKEANINTTATALASGASGASNVIGVGGIGSTGGGKRRSRSNRTNNHVVTDEKQYNIRLV